MVRLTVNGKRKRDAQGSRIDASLFRAPADKGVVEDLIVAAANDAKQNQGSRQTVAGADAAASTGWHDPLPPGFKL